MTTKEYLDRRWRWLGRIARGNGSQELQKLLTCSGWESIGRMADDIRMHMFSEMEPDGESARICVGITIRNQRDAGGARKPHRDRCGVASDVRRPCKGSSFGRGCKCSCKHHASCESGSKARVQSKNCIELLEQVLA